MTRAFVALVLVVVGVAGAAVSAGAQWSPAVGGLVAGIGLFLLGVLFGLGD